MSDLAFLSASAGGFGLVNYSLRLPQSHVMLVGPQSCGRHTSMGAHIRGYSERNSYLFMDEADIALGTIDDQIVDAVGEVLKMVPERPRVFIIMITCLPYIAGLDQDALLSRLRESIPDIAFQVFLMNPVSVGTTNSPGKILYRRIGELWDTGSEQDGSLNIIGSVIPPEKNSEFYEVMKECGVTSVNHIGSYSDFESFRKMGWANWNLVLKNDCRVMMDMMRPRMDYRFCPVSYEPDVIKRMYDSLFEMIKGSCELSGYEEEAASAVEKASRELKGKSICIGNVATMRPFGLARLMLSNGMNVTDILRPSPDVSPPPDYDMEAASWVMKNHPEIRYHDSSAPEMIHMIGGLSSADVAIGYDAAYYTGCRHIVGSYDDAGNLGYRGTVRLMKEIVSSLDLDADLRELLVKANLVI